MSDDFSFEVEEQQAPEFDPAVMEQQQTQLAALQAELAELKPRAQKAADLERFFAPQTQGNNADAFLNEFASKPQEVLNATVQQQVQQAIMQKQAEQALETEYSAKYPELVPFKQAILAEAGRLQYQSGNKLDDRAAIDAAVKQFNANLDQVSTVRQQKKFGQQNALPYTLTGSQLPEPGAKDWGSMDDATYAKERSSFLKGRGVSL